MEAAATKQETSIIDDDFFVPEPPPRSSRQRVLVFGTFDIIHPSHLRFLLEARKSCSDVDCELVVVLARDSSIKKIKGRMPIFNENQRLRLLSGLRLVDYARLGNEGPDHFSVILEVQPDSIVLGYDQVTNEEPLRSFIKQHNLTVRLSRLPKFESGDLTSSSAVRSKVLQMLRKELSK